MKAQTSRFSLRSVLSQAASLRTWLVAAIASLAILGSARQAEAQTTVTLQASKDSDMYSNSKSGANVNYGGCNVAWVGGKGSDERDRSLFAFDLTTLPANITITSAVLRLNTVSISESETTNRSVSVHAVTQAWTEGTGGCYPQTSNTSDVTWNRRTTGTNWTTAGGTFGPALATTTVGGIGAYNWTITSQAQSWYNSPSANNGVLLKYVDETVSDKYKAFATRQNATASLRPQLIITYTLNCTGSTGGASEVCMGGSANVTPATGGTWSSSNRDVATVTNAGVVYGVSPGTTTLTFVETSTGCQYTRTITVNSGPAIGGGSLVSPTSTLNYQFYDGTFATVDDIPTTGALGTGTAGSFNVTAIQTALDPGDDSFYGVRYTGFIFIPTAGTYTFYLNSDDQTRILINGVAVVTDSVPNDAEQIGTPVSLSAGWQPITVLHTQVTPPAYIFPTFEGPSIPKQPISFSMLSATLPSAGLNLCTGAVANLTPTTGGIWSSSNSSVVTVSNAGVVTGVAAGTATLTFTNTTTGCSSSIAVTVTAGPTLGGATGVCVGQTANVTPGTGGTWSSSNSAIASVTNGGVVTGVSPGTVTLTYVNSSTGCSSTRSFTVAAPPTLGGASVVCVGQTATVTPTSGGTWSSSNTGIATVSNTGVVTGISAGTVTLTFTNTSTGCSNTRTMTVNGGATLGGATGTCVGTSALVSPNTGGTWTSSNPSVASITNGGVVTGISGGTVTLTFTNSTTGCSATKPFTVSVPFGGNPVGIGGATAVCAGFQTNVTPTSGGFWSTSNSAIATVSNAGVVTGFSPGTVLLTYTESGTGCVSSVEFTVYPNVAITGPSSVCQGSSTSVMPNTNGTWTSSNPAIAFINNLGVVTGLQPGTVTLTFTSLGGCSDSKSFTVHPKPTALGAAAVQVGQTANVTPATGGTWVSSNPAIATVTNAGLVTGVTEGSVTLTFTDSTTGCTGTKAIAVVDPGFYKNIGSTDSGDKDDPNPPNNEDPEVIYPQSFTALVVTVFQDLDGDGDGDAPVPNVSITLRDAANNVVAVVTTGLDGSYTFNDLPPGFYTVTQTVPNGNFTLGPNPVAVSVVENDTVRADFVNSQLGQISGTIYSDSGDEPMSGVVVSLLDQSGAPVLDSNNQPITTTTNSNGFYIFDRVPPGTYQVQQTVPSGFTAVDDVDGGNLTKNGDVTPIVIGPGTVVTNQDFVNFQPGTISGSILIDNDLNLAGDAPHVGVTVALLNASGAPVLDGNNQPITTTTDALGNFTFTNLTPGDYRVAQTVPTGFTAISDSDGGNFAVVGDVTLLSVVAGENEVANFINQPQTDIAVDKTVSNSTPVVGTNVTFTIVVTNNGPQAATDVKVDDVATGFLYVSHTASKGTFSLNPGAPVNTFSGLWTVGSLAVGQSASLTVVATVTPNAIMSAYKNAVNAYSELGDPNPNNNDDEVVLNPVLGSISGTVTRDTTGDDVGDAPVAGVTVALVKSDGTPVLDANNQPLTAVTNASGAYSFTGLPPGNYRVVETVPAGTFPVDDVDGGNLAINGDVTPITLTGGQNVANQNFVIADAGSISGTIRQDTTGDNVGDVPLAGVVVVLQYPNGDPVLDANGDPITTVTDASGNYSFANIPPGDYRVLHVPPGGLIAVNDTDGGNRTVIGDVTPISVLPGQNVTGRNFVDAALGTISGAVLADADNNGTGDTGIVGVTLFLVNSSNVTIATTVTNSLGQYSFANVPPGTYRVVETQPVGYSSVSDTDGGNLDINGDVSPIVLLPGGNVTNRNFVEILNGNITGTVKVDTNNDDTGDAPLPGVTVTLKDSNGNDVDSDPNTPGVQPTTTTTDSLGNYTFTNVKPGNYQVVETDPPGYTSVTPNTVPVSISPGGSATANFVDESNGTITGFVRADTDGNGTGDVPLVGVVLTLKTAAGADIDSNPSLPGIQPTSTVTAANGSYTFTGLAPGTYQVVETQPSGYVSVSDVDGGNLNIIGDIVPISVVAGATTANQNFVEAQVGTITGSVTADTNNDNVGDVPLSGVTVTLKDGNGNDVDSDPNTPGVQPTTTTTNSSGVYSFPNLPPGTYQVVETDPSGYNSVTPNTVTTTLLPGATQTVNFVDEQRAAIAGNVFEDLNGLSDGIVNGTGTSGNGIYVNLVNASNNTVIASVPVAPNGTFLLNDTNGVQINSSYILILSASQVPTGQILTTSTLPIPWGSTGEFLGTGPGTDGIVNGILSVATTVGTLNNANFGIQKIPDVTPVITAIPNIMRGPTNFAFTIRVTELNSVNTFGQIVVRVPKDVRWVLNGAYNPTLTSIAGVPLNNANWAYSQDAFNHIFTSSTVIPAGGFSTIGFAASWNAGQTKGFYTATSQIDSFSGGEKRIDNNVDAEKIDYFID